MDVYLHLIRHWLDGPERLARCLVLCSAAILHYPSHRRTLPPCNVPAAFSAILFL